MGFFVWSSYHFGTIGDILKVVIGEVDYMKLQKIQYTNLNARQQESYNYQKISAVLAEYGFSTIKLSDDWNGADFLALHIDGEQQLKIQLKGRLTFDKKYLGKDIHICFPYRNKWYLYEHDELLDLFLKKYKDTFVQSKSWKEFGGYSWGFLSKENMSLLDKYCIK